MPYRDIIDMVRVRHGRLVGLRFAHKSASGHAHWLFACDCGAEVVVNGARVRSGRTASCGCLHRELSAARLTTHGRRAERRHDATYRAWQLINDYCANMASPGWRRHGGQGVRVHAPWRTDFPRFLADMGERPSGSHLKRIDAARGFSPGNCVWAPLRTRSERAKRAPDERVPPADERQVAPRPLALERAGLVRAAVGSSRTDRLAAR